MWFCLVEGVSSRASCGAESKHRGIYGRTEEAGENFHQQQKQPAGQQNIVTEPPVKNIFSTAMRFV